jgi:hypothetical protein
MYLKEKRLELTSSFFSETYLPLAKILVFLKQFQPIKNFLKKFSNLMIGFRFFWGVI